MPDGNPYIVDANEAVADVAYRGHEVIAIYPITPASPMGEHADAWAARRMPNRWGDVPQVVEMQSEGGAVGAVHGALQAGALTTTFTASQGLLLMLPNMYKIAGELTPAVIHVAARTVATHALSIFCDHSDVYAARSTGFALLASSSVQEAHDLAFVAQLASLRSRIPFLHFFDGFRTSHEIQRISRIPDEALANLLPESEIRAHRERALSPDHPVVRGTAHNPDSYFQARQAAAPFYAACAEHVEEAMDALAAEVGRRYELFSYHGHPEAERVIVLMGSASEAASEAVDWLVASGERVGLVNVRLYRPFSARHLLATLPRTTGRIAVLDRTWEPGAPGDPLYLDVVAALERDGSEATRIFATRPLVVGGRYGLSSKEVDPAMIAGVFAHIGSDSPRHDFTVGIRDDVSHSSIPWDRNLSIEPDDVVRALFYGLGADGTVSANKNSIKIIGSATPLHIQGYFQYDSKKSGARTVSHLRFGPRPIRSTYLIRTASFVACHQWGFLDRYDVLEHAAPGATFLLNAPFAPERVWAELPREVQEQIVENGIALHVIDAVSLAKACGLGGRINTIMQVCFFALTGILDAEEALRRIEASIQKSYGHKGRELVDRNLEAIRSALDHLHQVEVPDGATSTRRRPPTVSVEAPDFVQRVTATLLAGRGDLLPVSAFPPDGTWPVGTTRWEKRAIALEVPVWVPDLCIQCNKCALVCPHAAIRTKVYPEPNEGAPPDDFLWLKWKGPGFAEHHYAVQVAPEDCTGCGVCVEICPAKDRSEPKRKAIGMRPLADVHEVERGRYEHFLDLPEVSLADLPKVNVKTSQLLQPLFEYSGACSGCGETPYVKLMTQLFGDHMLIANATGCSSIYGGNLPTTPYTTNPSGRGPAWSNSLFEDNAEFGLGMAVATDQLAAEARNLVLDLAGQLGDLVEVTGAPQDTPEEIAAQHKRLEALQARLGEIGDPRARRLEVVAEHLLRRSVWIVGGDGWAYDIGYGGLDHVLASGRDVNILVLDTEVYSNTGGQQSKATPLGAVAKFAASGKDQPKKDLGLHAISYGNVYVAQVAYGAADAHTVKVFLEAESYRGPSLIVAYSHCIAHGYDLIHGPAQQKLAVDSAYWPLYRYDPRRRETGKAPLQLDSKRKKVPFARFAENEMRFRILQNADPRRASKLLGRAQEEIERRFTVYSGLATGGAPPPKGSGADSKP